MQATLVPGTTGCLRCVFEAPPLPGSTPTCDTAGVLGPVVQVVAACQAADALKLLLGRLDLLSGTMLDIDLWANQRRRVELGGPRQGCPCCAARRFEFLDGERAGLTTSLCGRHAVQVRPPEAIRLDLSGLARRLAPHGDFTTTMFLVRGVLKTEQGEDGPLGLTVFSDGRALVHGTDRPEVARTVYSRYVGV
jgi:adenylyltransferase/sulfurtransferase